MAKRVLIYSHDTFGLGNIRRNHALALHLVRANPGTRVLLLTSSRWFHLLPSHPRVEFVKLPELVRVERGTYRSRSAGVAIDPLFRVRREIIRGATKGFRPDLLLVDKIPLGTSRELLRTFERLDGEKPRIVLVLRDVVDEPEWTRRSWEDAGQFDALARFYHGVWIFGDPSVYDTAAEYGLNAIGNLDIRYCGYISKEDQRPSVPSPSTDRDSVLITVGGGEDGHPVLDLVASALEGVPEGSSIAADVVLGPYLPEDTRAMLTDRFRQQPGVRCVDYVPDLPGRIRSSRAVVSMGGYNTVCEILAAHTPALVIPRFLPGREQTIRAQRMSSLGFFRSIPVDEESRPSLVESIRSFLLDPKQSFFPRPDMRGLERAGQLARAMS